MPCSECRTIVDDTWARYAEDRALFFLTKEDLSWRWTAAATENPNSRLHIRTACMPFTCETSIKQAP